MYKAEIHQLAFSVFLHTWVGLQDAPARDHFRAALESFFQPHFRLELNVLALASRIAGPSAADAPFKDPPPDPVRRSAGDTRGATDEDDANRNFVRDE